MLNMLAMQKELTLMVLMELQNRGVSLHEIYGLSKIIDLERRGKEGHYGYWQADKRVIKVLEKNQKEEEAFAIWLEKNKKLLTEETAVSAETN